MNPATTSPAPGPIDYPETDGKPMAENTLQLQWIVTLYDNLATLYADNPDVFVGGDQLWYPVEGRPDIVTAPDVYVIFGRPKGHRSSYKQWEEGNVPMTVVFEVLSPGNTQQEMADKQAFYDEYGVEEYYLYDPDANRLQVFLRHGEVLRRERMVQDHVSPRLGIRFDLSTPEMTVYVPDGTPCRSFQDVADAEKHARQQAEASARLAALERQRADDATRQQEQQRQRADEARQREEQALQQAEAATQREEQERQRADDATRRAEALAVLVGKLRRGEATPEDLAELDRLGEAPTP
jgi:Uma2 family endonuclease